MDLATATLHLCAADAAARGIRHADQVRVYNGRGACLLRASVDERVRPGVVCAPSSRWAKRAPDQRNINALTSDRLTDFVRRIGFPGPGVANEESLPRLSIGGLRKPHRSHAERAPDHRAVAEDGLEEVRPWRGSPDRYGPRSHLSPPSRRLGAHSRYGTGSYLSVGCRTGSTTTAVP